jgi:type III restriction enzyme
LAEAFPIKASDHKASDHPALEALYGHYVKTYELWIKQGIAPPCFIVVCNNTATSKLVYDYISGSQLTTLTPDLFG